MPNDNVLKASSSPRLILLTQWFDPEPTFKGMIFAHALQARGFAVEVVTGFPNYPGGKLYAGYEIRLIQREVIDGINVTRLPLYPSHDRGALGRVANYVSFCLSSAFYLVFLAQRADILYVYHPPLTAGIAAVIAKLFRRTPTVIDVQDMWPDTLSATGMLNNMRVLKLVACVCKWIYRQVSHIVVLSPGFRDLLIERGVPPEKISIIYNWADEASIVGPAGPPPALMAAPGKFRILYAGNMGHAQALDTVIAAARILVEPLPDVEFCFLGGGLDVDRLKEATRALHLDNVRFLPPVPMAEVGNYLANADCLLVHLRADPLFAITIPSKTQAYMAAGKPVIMAVEGDAAALIVEAGAGLAVPPENPQALAAAVRDLASREPEARQAMGQAGQRFYRDKLALGQGVDGFVQLFVKNMRRSSGK